jgi:hypothetical protein
MNVATLTVTGDVSRSLSMRLALGETAVSATIGAPDDDVCQRLAAGAARGGEVAGLLPTEVVRAIRLVYNARAVRTLAIVASSPALDVIPWERMPRAIGLPGLSVVRVLSDQRRAPACDAGDTDAREARPPGGFPAPGDGDADTDTALLVTGWSGAPTLDLPGIQHELAALGHLAATEGISCRVLSELTIEQLLDAWTAAHPRCVHIAAPAVVYDDSGAKIAISGTDQLELVLIDDALAPLRDLQTDLVVINTSNGGFAAGQRSASRVVAERLSTTTISWYGAVDDQQAADFARFFYARLADGSTPLDAVTAFNRLRLPSAGASTVSAHTETLPTIWSPSIAALHAQPLGMRAPTTLDPDIIVPRRVEMPHRELLSVAPREFVVAQEPQLLIEFDPQRWLNPALLKNQYPAIARLVLTAVDEPIRGVGLSITCDTGAGQSTVAITQDLERGPQPVKLDDVKFPVLYQLIDQSAERRWVNFTARCTHRGTVLAETTRSVLWMGRSAWLDREDMWQFIPAFVDPVAPGVLDVIDASVALLKSNAPTRSFDGYQSGDRALVSEQVATIFNCLREMPINYIDVPPLEPYLPGDMVSAGQTVRTPDEVIERHRGTCNDLAILFASCLEQVGIKPLIVLAPGHTYAGFWTSSADAKEFWTRACRDPLRLPQTPGRGWMIKSRKELRDLAEKGSVLPVEATLVADRSADFDSALTHGHDNLFSREPLDVAVDVYASRQSVQPL